MKKILTSVLFLLLLSTLIACADIIDNSPKIEVEIDFNDYSIKKISNDLTGNIELIPDFISLNINLSESTLNYGLKINSKTVDTNRVSISNNILTYNFKAKDFIGDKANLTTLVKLDPAGGLWSKDDLAYSTPDFEFTDFKLNDLNTTDLAIFNNVTTGLRWHYKLFVKFDSALDAYKVIYADPRESSIENLNIGSYDFIIGLHYQNPELETNTELKNLFSYASVNRIVLLNEELSSATTIKIYSNEPNEDSYQVYLNEEYLLPTPIRNEYDFLGWFDGVNIIQSFTPYQASTDNYIKVLTAQYSGLSIESLDTYLKSQIPSFTETDLVLPVSYSDYTIIWESSNESIISATGKFNNSFNDSNVTLTANITKSNGSTYKYSYQTEVRMMKSLNNNIAAGYIYRSYENLPDLLFETLDVINAAFLDVDTNGNLNGTTYLNNIVKHIMPRAKVHGNHVIVVIGPASEPSVWNQVGRSQEKIDNMANQIVEVINAYGFHGVDLDWETPNESEKANFTKLAKAVYQKVKANNPNHIVTAAIAGGIWQMPRYDLLNSHQYLDYVNMMMYGLTNSGGRYQNPLKAATSWHNSTLQLGATTSSTSIVESVALFNSYGIPNSKLIVGLAFYGIKHVRTGSVGSFTSFTNGGSVFYQDIVEYMKNPNYTHVYDTRAGVPYIYKNDGTEFISFDDPQSIDEKVRYARQNGLAGMMFWEYGTDTTNILLEALKTSMYK